MSHILALLITIASAHLNFDKSNCTCNGKTLSGSVRIVEHNADIRVSVVNFNEDLTVRKSDRSIGNKCGEWYFTDGPADFTIEFVEYNPDLRIRFQ
ncbi:MAG TPA: hypothetical protein PLA77_08880 [Bacteroidales bacterium]|nr:hypothetical protein [Bacteroidales bacterium]